ncbi:hypothetical protein F751_3670 [Auxenochlorella protothecoides]|uniref:Uncharacterized protein n=1 Tax=Auxenochlorella protothecoides TaxID=3075 RepID=A0A087SJX8_AUXPR|nr:hypothetical protein F751_3670 [Auxenochlorella protothecoides]KFM26032.1 hypothetical protein F751_3670 [Auxenochlorella protothecoides]
MEQRIIFHKVTRLNACSVFWRARILMEWSACLLHGPFVKTLAVVPHRSFSENRCAVSLARYLACFYSLTLEI